MPIYSSDDRFNDDVHYMGGAMRALDLVDYPSFMIAMNAMPPVPSLWDGDWREEWQHRIESNEPWVFTVAKRAAPAAVLAGRIGSTRLRQRHVPHDDRGRMGRWLPQQYVSHGRGSGECGDPVEAADRSVESHGRGAVLPGPWIDLTAEMAKWFDRWLRDEQNGIDAEPQVTIFHRRSTAPEPDLREVNGTWRDHIGLPLADTKTLDLISAPVASPMR